MDAAPKRCGRRAMLAGALREVSIEVPVVINIPGYRIVRQLGSGGMSTVYLAIQQSVDREVALKVMTPALAADPRYSERFLREARIAAKLHHRHVVGIHDVGRSGERHFIAMEYLSGGVVTAPAGGQPNVPFVLRVLREIAVALHYAHGKGVVHRDVKPDNILLREDGAAALTDFGIARATDAMSSMTRTGAVIGTPHYMSPEQARGQALDGRADLYSLGVVMHELLVGEVPYQADDPLAVGIKHLTAPLPCLPDVLAPLQPILDGLMAKEPAERFQDGASVAVAIESIEAAILAGELPTLGSPDRVLLPPIDQRMTPPLTPRIATPTQKAPSLTRIFHHPPTASADPSGVVHAALFVEVDVVSTTPSSTFSPQRTSQQRSDTLATERGEKREPELRAEPMIGELSAAEIERPERRRHASRRSARRWPWVAMLLLSIAVVAVLQQERLRALIPRTELNVLLVDAEQAYLAGRLHGDERSAETLYRAVLDIEPDHDVARSGLRKVAEAQAERARQALQGGDIDAARVWLHAARATGAAPTALSDIEAALRDADRVDQTRAEALDRARQAALEGRIEGGEDTALAQLLVLHERHPDDREIEQELDHLAAGLLDDVAGYLAAGDRDGAQARIDAVAAWRPVHPRLVEVRAALAAAEEARRADLERLLSTAEARLRQGRLTRPAGDSALDHFRALLARSPDHTAARSGIRRVAAGLAAQAERALGALEFDQVDALIAEAAALAPDLGQLAALRNRLRDARERAAVAMRTAEMTAVQRAERDRLLAAAAVAETAGQLLYPPGDSAYDHYRAVLAVDPHNGEATAAMERLPESAVQHAEEALAANRLNAARGFVEGLAQLAPGDVRLPALRRRTADALLASARERLAAGQRQSAQSALEAAREIDTENPLLGEIERLLHGE